MIFRDIGTPTGNAAQDIKTLFDYMAHLKEQLVYSEQDMNRRINELKKGDGES